jgi:hypothetical protein
VAPVAHEPCRQRDETGSILSLMTVCADIPQGAFALIRYPITFFEANPALDNLFNGSECAPTSPFDLVNSQLQTPASFAHQAQLVAVIKRYQRQTAMNRKERRTDAGLKPA